MKIEIILWGEDETNIKKEVTEEQFNFLKEIENEINSSIQPKYSPYLEIRKVIE